MTDIWTSVDPLGEALHFLRMRGIFYTRSEFSAPWGLALPAFADSLMFHVVTAGRCWLEVGNQAPRMLQTGEFALVPHGKGHQISSQPGAFAAPLFELPRTQISDRYEVLRHGGGGTATHMVCGTMHFDHPAARQLVALMPDVLVVDAWSSPQMEWMQSTLRLMAAEAQELRPGGETVITRLADVLVVQAIRSWLATDPAAQTGWLGALQDKQIGRALVCIHREPARAWTVATLADAVAMSRSAFAARFTQLVGETPMQYVTRWRMQVALSWINDDGVALGDLAPRLGYQSEAAFSRAFKRFIGVSPGAARRHACTARSQPSPQH